ncbi:ABC transporter substrate-binding protein [Cupriavidus sp. YAF13]|uniref:ABC transporter substrate-binding protein n=1 Tax=Cupriavidus sp. YAF13 TaxID=3233075 RepID=UPI003F8F618B
MLAIPLLVAAAGAAEAKTPDDQLVMGLSLNNLLSLDPAAATGNDVVEVACNVYDYLVELDPHDITKVLSGLAETWTIAPDRRSITFTLRRGVKFQSGNPLTAEDAAWSLRRVLKLNLAMASPWKSYGFTAQNVDQLIRATDPLTLVVELPKPTDPKIVLYTLGTSVSSVILDRKKVMEHDRNGDLGAAWLTTNAAGSGPFVMNEWRAKEVLLLSRFDGYWRGPAKLRRVILRHMTESQTLRLMLGRGDIDIASGMSVPDIAAMKNAADTEVHDVMRGTLYYIAVNAKDPRFADRRVRQAVLRHLVDFDGINRTVMPHYGVYHQRPVPLGLHATLPEPGYRLDNVAARKLLAEAGFASGFKTTIRVVAESPFTNIATNLQSTLAKAGIEASILPGTGNQVYGAMRDRNFEIIVGRGGGGAEPHPHSSLRALVYNPDNRDAARLTNFQGWRTSYFDPQLNQLIESALLQQDEGIQAQTYQDAQRLFDAEVPAIQPISQMIETVVLRKDVRNFAGHPSATTRLREVYKQR